MIDHLYRYFTSLKDHIFGNHDDMCKGLHVAIQDELGIKVSPVFCTTSVARGDIPYDYAYAHCLLSLEPTSVRNQVYLDFQKWLWLEPDLCSLKFYAANREELKSFIFGTEPEFTGLSDDAG